MKQLSNELNYLFDLQLFAYESETGQSIKAKITFRRWNLKRNRWNFQFIKFNDFYVFIQIKGIQFTQEL